MRIDGLLMPFVLRPGHYLSPGVSEEEGMKAILNERLGPEDGVGDMDWEIGECISTWWRPAFEQYMVSCQHK
jgi:cleavage and polyadenylation specificity factor subunit 5